MHGSNESIVADTDRQVSAAHNKQTLLVLPDTEHDL